MKALGKLMLGLIDFVPQEEADRRAKICGSCYYNVHAEGCSGCAKIASLITGPVANRHTKYDSMLKVCAVCRCNVVAKVHFPLDQIPTDDRQQTLFPDFCWQKIQTQA